MHALPYPPCPQVDLTGRTWLGVRTSLGQTFLPPSARGLNVDPSVLSIYAICALAYMHYEGHMKTLVDIPDDLMKELLKEADTSVKEEDGSETYGGGRHQ